jgi:hypothetical protein
MTAMLAVGATVPIEVHLTATDEVCDIRVCEAQAPNSTFIAFATGS